MHESSCRGAYTFQGMRAVCIGASNVLSSDARLERARARRSQFSTQFSFNSFGWFPLRGLGIGYGTTLGDWIQGAVAVRIRPQLSEKGDKVTVTGNLTAGAATPLELFKIGPQSPRKLGNEDVPYGISCDGL